MGMDLCDILYCPLQEDKTQNNKYWEKQTVKFALAKRGLLISFIRNNTKKYNLQSFEHDDIYQELFMSLYNSEDYNVEKAIPKSNADCVISLQSYVQVCARYAIKKYITSEYKSKKNTVNLYCGDKGEDGETSSLIENMEDQNEQWEYDKIFYDIGQFCSHFECNRYRYGFDLFLILYIRLLTTGNDAKYYKILGVLGLSKRDLLKIKEASTREETIINIVTASAHQGTEKTLQEIEKYVYGAKNIRETIQAMA